LPADCKNLNIDSGATVTIESDATNSGSLIIQGTVTGTGNVIYNRYIKSSSAFYSSDRAYIISSPVSGQSASALTASGQISGLAQYDEGNNAWGGSVSGNLAPGVGYSLYRAGSPYIVPFTGIPNYGNIPPVPVSSSYEKYGWNSLGNPYTSALKIRPGATDFLLTNLATLHPGYAAVYIWDEDFGNYAVINLVSLDPLIWNPEWNTATWYNFQLETDDIVQAGQGFLVNIKWPTPSPSVIVFNKNMQVHNTAITLKNAEKTWPAVNLMAQNGTNKTGTIVAFNEGGTTGLDPGYDAGLLSVNPFQLFTRLVTGTEDLNLTIQTLPDNQYNQIKIPVGINCPNGGEITFKAMGVKLPDGLYPILEDKLLHVFTPLKTVTDSYSTVIPTNTTGSGRFYLSFGNITDIKNVKQPEITYSAWYVNRKIIIFGTGVQEAKAALFDMNGRKVGEYSMLKENRNEIEVQGLANGMYLLHIKGKGGTQVIKVPVVSE
jgi:hypothetical protein